MNGSESRRPLAITGATLIDGTGRPPLVNAADVIDGGGKFVIPGLTDMHVHVLGPDRWHVPLFLAAGVTTVLDLGGQLPDLMALRDAIDAGTMPGPRLLYTGPFLEEGEPFAG